MIDITSPEQTAPSVPAMKWWPMYAIIAASFLGLLDAGYLTYERYAGKNLKCFIAQGCDVVTTSVYSEIFGIPLSLFGLLFYLTVFVLALVINDTKNIFWHRFILWVSTPAFAVSVVLVYLQLFVLRAVCIYCMTSAALSTLIFVCAWVFNTSIRKTQAPNLNS